MCGNFIKRENKIYSPKYKFYNDKIAKWKFKTFFFEFLITTFEYIPLVI